MSTEQVDNLRYDEKVLLVICEATDEPDKRISNLAETILASMNFEKEPSAPGPYVAFIVDLKKLIFTPVNMSFSKNFNQFKTVKNFDELERFVEDFKFKFSAKKFGL